MAVTHVAQVTETLLFRLEVMHLHGDRMWFLKEEVVLRGGSFAFRMTEEEEVTSPLKKIGDHNQAGKSKKVLFLEKDGGGSGQPIEEKDGGKEASDLSKDDQATQVHVGKEANSAMQVDKTAEPTVVHKIVEEEGIKGGHDKGRKYKRLGRDRERQGGESTPNISGCKRALQEDEVASKEEKKSKVDMKIDEAGLSEQPCRDQ